MSDDAQGKLLADWLAGPPGAPPPPELDPAVVEAVLALRPERAPALRLSADDLLADLAAGPLVEAQAVPAGGAHPELPAPANAPRWRRWMLGAGGSSALLVAALALFALRLPKDYEPPAPAAPSAYDELAASGPSSEPEPEAAAGRAPAATTTATPTEPNPDPSPLAKPTVPPAEITLTEERKAKREDAATEPTPTGAFEPSQPASGAGGLGLLDAQRAPADTKPLGGEGQRRAEAEEEARKYASSSSSAPAVAVATPSVSPPVSPPQAQSPAPPPAPAVGQSAAGTRVPGTARAGVDADMSAGGAASDDEAMAETVATAAPRGPRPRDRQILGGLPAPKASNVAEPVAMSEAPAPAKQASLEDLAEAEADDALAREQASPDLSVLRARAVPSDGDPRWMSAPAGATESSLRAAIVPPASTGQPAAVTATRWFLDRGRPGDAASAARAGLALGDANTPARAWLLVLLGDAEAASGRPGEAASRYRQAEALNASR